MEATAQLRHDLGVRMQAREKKVQPCTRHEVRCDSDPAERSLGASNAEQATLVKPVKELSQRRTATEVKRLILCRR